MAGISGGELKAGPVSAPIVPLALLGIGLYLTWFGVHYWARGGWPTAPVKSVLQGKGLPDPGSNPGITTAQLTADVSSATAGGSASPSGTTTTSATSSSIANDALKYVGKGYVWGGPADTPGDWDCSSFCSYVLGHDLGLALPGGGHYGDQGYPPHSHGPTTLTYMLYGKSVNYGSEQPGDLLISAEHMGICIGGGQMISAQDPQLGTGTGGYQSGFPGGQPTVRRVGSSGTLA